MLKHDAPQSARKKPVNRFGRKGGRGLRPYLLIPKIIAVAVLLGGLVGIIVLIETSPRRTQVENQIVYDHVAALFTWMVLPGAGVAVLCGVALAAMHGTVMFTRRWLIVKTVVLLVGGSLLWVAGTWLTDFIAVRIAWGEPDGPRGAWGALSVVCGLAVVMLVGIIILGRQKPRLGQPIRPRRKPKRKPQPTPSGESEK